MPSKNKPVIFSNKELFYENSADVWPKYINNAETNKRLKVVFADLLVPVDLKGKKLLEVGCGMGYFSQMAIKKGARVTGLDVGKKLISISKSKCPTGNFVVGSALRLPFKSGDYDVVISTEVIEHCENPQKAISEIIRVLKPGGKAVITTPNKLFKLLFDFLSWIKIRPYQGNENWLSREEMKRAIIKSGGKIVKEKHFNFIYPTPALDMFEKIPVFENVMINQGYLITK
jgi:2-polyprenyl-3-methyl-5-hydroxy-6-metoxy-1,4-benzoquinol methylase